MMKAFLLTVMWVLPGMSSGKPDITQYDLQVATIEECYKAGLEHSKEMFEKHNNTGSVRYICFDKENIP